MAGAHDRSHAPSGWTLPPLEPGLGEVPPGISPSQERIWLLEQLDPGNLFYRLARLGRIHGPLDLDALAHTVDALGRRHAALRTTFPTQGPAGPRPHVADQPEQLITADLTGIEPSAREAALRRWVAEESGSRLSASRGPVFRVAVARFAEDEHVLSLCAHHIVADGWAMQLLLDELKRLYGRLIRGEPPELEPVTLTYADYVAWRATWPQGMLDEQLAYWQEQLANLPPPMALPGDRAGPPGIAGDEDRRVFPDELATQLRRFVRAHRTTLYTVQTAILGTLLHRYTGLEDLLIACPVAGRDHGETNRVVGCFINTLLLRIPVSPDLTFRELVARTGTVLRTGLRHQDVPFERVLDWLRSQQGGDRTLPFAMMINALPDPWAISLPGLEVTAVARLGLDSPLPFELYLGAANRIVLRARYQRRLYSEACIGRYLDQLQHLLGQVIDDPDRPLFDYDLRLPASSVAEPDPTASLELCDYGLVERFIDHAGRAPEAPAITDGTRTWTYGEISRMARAIAQRLRDAGVAPGRLVAVAGPAGPESVAAMLAAFSLRAVLLTLDATLPARRLAQMLELTGCALVAGVGKAPAWLTTHGDTAQWVELEPGLQADEPLGCLPAAPDDPAYTFFTSGSTGTPRAVVGTTRGLGHFLAWQRQRFEVGPGDRCAQVTGLSFDVVLRELFLPLTSGATLVLPTAAAAANPAEMIAWLAAAEISLVHAVPSIAEQWLATAGGLHLPGLRWLFLAGEPLYDVLVRRWRDVVPTTCGIVNLYGPTETTLAKCAYVVPPEPQAGLQPVGEPLPGTQIFVTNASRRRCAVGEPGEIVIRTPYRTRGYLGDEEATAQRFIPNPWSDDPADLVYCTGDRGRLRDDGLIEVSGRLDRQVKIHGVRVEPGEVTATLAQHPEVRSCIAVGRADADGHPELVAYLVPQGAATMSTSDVRAFLARQLPTAMIPSQLVVLPELPLLPNGKVDVRALPAPEGAAAEPAARFVAPRTSLEELVASLFEEALGVTPVGAHDDFFTLGGQSLVAAQVVARLRRATNVEVPLGSFFEHPTVAGLAGYLTRRLESDRPAAPPPPTRREGRTEAPASFGQERLWFLDRLEPGSDAYHLPRAFRLQGALDRRALEASLATVVERQAVMRARLHLTEGGPVQTVEELPGPFLAIEDLTEHPASSRESVLRRRITEEARRPFDLSQAPLWRARLFALGPEDHVLLVVVHHIIADGWSLNLLAAELSAGYGAWVEGRPPSLPPLPIDYADFATWQRTHLEEATLAPGLGYWRRKLEGHTAELQLPLDRPRAQRPPGPAGRVARVLPESLTARLRELAREHDATLFIVLLAGFKALLARYAEADDITVGCPVAGRSHVEHEPLVGLFTTTLLLRTDLAGGPSFRDAVSRVRETLLEAHAHQEVPFERLVEELSPARHLGRNPLFQVMFALHNLTRHPLSLTGLAVERLENELGTAKFDWFVALHEEGETLRAVVEYDTALFDADTLERMLEHYEVLLQDGVAHPDRPVTELRLLAATDEACLTEANRTALAVPDACLHELFADQVRRTPEATALRDDQGDLTYAELATKANRLAHSLQRLGVGPEVTVGVCLERSRELAVTLLGVLQAGGAYVPLDPTYPTERLAFMLDDSQARVVVTRTGMPEMTLGHGVARLDLDRDAATIAANPAAAPESAATPASLAHIIYTSGSTGRPKGVEGIHRATVNRLAWMWHELPFDTDDVCCLKTTIGFVDAIAELFGPLLAGVPNVVVPAAAVGDPRELVALLARQRVTRITLVPSLLETLLDVYPDLAARLPRLTLWAVSGEPLRPDLRDLFVGRLPGARLLNIYGTTEVTADATWGDVTQQTGAVTIGRPLANLTAHVLDRLGQPVPLGIPGDLFIGGLGVARGYRHQPSLSADAFVTDPESGERRYRTGDRARWRPSGVLQLLGRRDDQVQIRGQRVELGEVQRQLLALPAIEEAAVVAREDRPGDLCLVAYAVGPGPWDEGALRQALGRHLPSFMIPSALVRLEGLPRLPNGKLDRQALPAPQALGREARPPAPAMTPRQEALAEIWRELLGVDEVGLHESFFDLGGHSLLAVRLVATVERRLGQRLELAILFREPTVAGLDAALDAGEEPPSVLVHLGGRGTPTLVLVHALGGDLLCYRELVAHLGTKRATYGLQVAGALDDGMPPEQRLAALATRYVRALSQLTGPVVLAGWSLGGVIAQEMARQLTAGGAAASPPVTRLLLLDAWARGGPGPVDGASDRRARAQRDWLRQGLRAHEPRAWSGPVVLLRAADEPHADAGDASLGWSTRCDGSLEVLHVPGTHHTMLQGTQAKTLATTMQTFLER